VSPGRSTVPLLAVAGVALAAAVGGSATGASPAPALLAVGFGVAVVAGLRSAWSP